MTVTEALRASKEDGRAYTRRVLTGWVRWRKGAICPLSVEDLVADDWIPVGEAEPASGKVKRWWRW